MLVSELDVDDVVSWLRGAVGDLTGAVLLVLCVDVYLTGPLDGQAQAAIAWMEGKRVQESEVSRLCIRVQSKAASLLSQIYSYHIEGPCLSAGIFKDSQKD